VSAAEAEQAVGPPQVALDRRQRAREDGVVVAHQVERGREPDERRVDRRVARRLDEVPVLDAALQHEAPRRAAAAP
jgi:hypothetical protein